MRLLMLAWAFPCVNAEEVGALVHALGKHRYLQETDHRLHWTVDAALADYEPFAGQARRFVERRHQERELDPSSYDSSLWRSCSAEEIAEVLRIFWTPGRVAMDVASRLRALLQSEGLPIPPREPFGGDADFPDHPQLIQLSWRLLPIQDLDPERHRGVLQAMEDCGEEVDVSAPIDQEGPDLGVLELIEGAQEGALCSEFLIWADGSRVYNDYIFRGICKSAKFQWKYESPEER